MLKIPTEAELNRGILAINVSLSLLNDFINLLKTKYSANLLNFSDSESPVDEKIKILLFEMYKIPWDDKPYNIVSVSDDKFYESFKIFSDLLLEARKLKLIFVVHTDKLLLIPEEFKDMLFATIPNFLMGGLNEEQRTWLQSRIGVTDLPANASTRLSLCSFRNGISYQSIEPLEV